MQSLLLPHNTHASAWPLLQGRALRAFADGYVAILLPAYLLALGLPTWAVGLLATATLLGSALATLALGTWGHRLPQQRLLGGAALMMAATGFAFALSTSFWPLLLVAFLGTLNPSSGDVSVFLPLEHTRLAGAAEGDARIHLFARYSLAGALFSACGALAAAWPDAMAASSGIPPLWTMRAMFILYGAIGCVLWLRYRGLPAPLPALHPVPAPLGVSRTVVIRLAALFCVDSFASGLIVNALMALWLFQRFGLALTTAGQFFFWSGLCSASSQLLAPLLARRMGLLRTMVLTHIPASLCLIAAALTTSMPWALGLLLVRALLSQMDVPARSAFVMAVVTPAERSAAASFTLVPKSLAAAAGPVVGAMLWSSGFMAAPLLVCGVLKIAYDLAIWRSFRHS